MTLLQKLQSKGVKVYTSTPLWQQVEELGEVTIDDNNVVMESPQYKTHQLAMETPEGRVYISLKNGTATDKTSYKLVEFTATKDWEEYSISAGDCKVFAV